MPQVGQSGNHSFKQTFARDPFKGQRRKRKKGEHRTTHYLHIRRVVHHAALYNQNFPSNFKRQWTESVIASALYPIGASERALSLVVTRFLVDSAVADFVTIAATSVVVIIAVTKGIVVDVIVIIVDVSFRNICCGCCGYNIRCCCCNSGYCDFNTNVVATTVTVVNVVAVEFCL